MDVVNCVVTTVPNLPRSHFLEAVGNAWALVGNSSAGIIEAPSLGTVSINIGDRQKGRETAKSVIHCKESVSALKEAILRQSGMTMSKATFSNPYYKKGCLDEITQILNKYEH